ncbi:odorant receptor 10a-like [Ostrinia furnacalis]|uniref:odorant receptor 10a-like n=1 Tax=Ostrinia furnacalis TaxID=93504 RepID=UPI00103DCD50|nr:odorant receptor 10a-like [Ostrinia furnacalis]
MLEFTILSVFAALLFGGVFIYVGSFSQLIYLSQVFPDKIKSFQAINCWSSTVVPLSKFIFMFTSSSRLRKIMELSREGLTAVSENSSAHKQMLAILRKAHMVSWLVILNQCFTHFVYLILPVFFTILSNDRYLPTMPGDIYGIFSKYESPYYEIAFILTIIATLFSVINQTGYIVLFVVLLAHELGHFYAICEILNEIHGIVYNQDLISDAIKNNGQNEEKESSQMMATEHSLTEIQKPKKIQELLVFCVKHHQFIMRFHAKIGDLYKVIFGAHFLIMVIVLVTTLQTLNSWGLINTALTGLTAVMPLVVYCFGGEMLISSSLAMADAVYACGWEGMRVKQARIALLILCVAQHPLYYTAAGIFIMNRETFGDVAQVVYKIYAVFN